MCGFFFSTINQFSGPKHSKLMARGPDAVADLTINGFRFVHTHLAVFSQTHEQPYVDRNHEVVVMFNGEIYNTPDAISECEFIVERYLSHGLAGFENLDGEFAILIVDFPKREIVIATDPFGTKPCYFSNCRAFWVSSYPSAIEIEGVPAERIRSAEPNTGYRFCLDTKRLIESKNLVSWNLEQIDETYERWVSAFEDAVKKRATHMRPQQMPFVGVSSGYDSGAIHAALIKMEHEFLGLSITGNERENSIVQRREISASHGQIHLILNDKSVETALYLSQETFECLVEDFPYEILSDSRRVFGEPDSVYGDKASKALCAIDFFARQHGSFICLSGSGADEIISDYGVNGKPIYQHSNFGGLWPDDLRTIFPWASFYYSTQQAYLRKEESVGGAFGIETRYPFLDKYLVQAYLNLCVSLKNRAYKAPIAYYLESCGYPYQQEKLGFSPFKAGEGCAA